MPDTAVNDNAPLLDLTGETDSYVGDAQFDAVISAAVLVSTAFRLRDEDALILTLRRLTEAVAALEEAAEASAEVASREAACG
jgi:hypothetical protein